MQDLVDKRVIQSISRPGLRGGFSYSDVLGAATGWSSVLTRYKDQLMHFTIVQTRSRLECNGCQLLAKIGWINARLDSNDSQRFESRFCTLQVQKSENIFLRGLEGLTLGMWSAHGEGKFVTDATADEVGIVYVDDDNQPTEKYPCNPNGSQRGIAALSSGNYRHLGIMPHPERSFYSGSSHRCTTPILATRHLLHPTRHGFVYLQMLENGSNLPTVSVSTNCLAVLPI